MQSICGIKTQMLAAGYFPTLGCTKLSKRLVNSATRTIPLIDIEGTAYECGRNYAGIVIKEYPLFRKYLDSVHRWKTLPDELNVESSECGIKTFIFRCSFRY